MLSGPASADEILTAQDADWGGPYAGFQLGYGVGTIGDRDPHGVHGGVHAGYNFDFGTAVLGAEVDLNIVDISSEGNRTFDQLAYAKVRAGVDLGRTLAYATAGPVYTLADVGPGPNEEDIGYAIGVGLEVTRGGAFRYGWEYLFHDFGDLGNSGLNSQLHIVRLRVSYRF